MLRPRAVQHQHQMIKYCKRERGSAWATRHCAVCLDLYTHIINAFSIFISVCMVGLPGLTFLQQRAATHLCTCVHLFQLRRECCWLMNHCHRAPGCSDHLAEIHASFVCPFAMMNIAREINLCTTSALLKLGSNGKCVNEVYKPLVCIYKKLCSIYGVTFPVQLFSKKLHELIIYFSNKLFFLVHLFVSSNFLHNWNK